MMRELQRQMRGAFLAESPFFGLAHARSAISG